MSEETGARRLPGDPTPDEMIDRILRVDQAGEYGAKRIYEGQLAVLGRSQSADATAIRHMAEQEQKHLDAFNRLMAARHTRPTLLSPIWHVAGFALGAGTAVMGPRAAMACTAAVEEAIVEHYEKQSAYLGADQAELKATVESARADEMAHREAALAAGAERAAGYDVLSFAIKRGTKLAIWLSERI